MLIGHYQNNEVFNLINRLCEIHRIELKNSFVCSDPVPLELTNSDTVGCLQSHSHSAAKMISPIMLNPISASSQLIMCVSISLSSSSPFLLCCARLNFVAPTNKEAEAFNSL